MAAGTFGLGQSLRPTGVGPEVSTWKRRYRMIRLRCIRTSPDHYSVLLFLGDCKGEPMAAQSTAQRSSAIASTLTSLALVRRVATTWRRSKASHPTRSSAKRSTARSGQGVSWPGDRALFFSTRRISATSSGLVSSRGSTPSAAASARTVRVDGAVAPASRRSSVMACSPARRARSRCDK
jgi:hypothetical protein